MTFSLVLVILAFTNVIHPTYFSSSLFRSAPAPTPTSIDIESLAAGGQPNLSSLIPSLNIIPPAVLQNTLNLSTHFFLMMFIGGFGYKIAMIGVNLIRPIVVKTSEKTLEAIDPPPDKV